MQAAASQSGAERALPLVLARLTQDLFGQAIRCLSLRSLRYSLGEVLDQVPERALIAVLDGPAEAGGVMVLSPDLLAGLIEAQTLGRVSAQPLLLRRPTRTDAAMVADWIDGLLSGLEAELLSDDDLIWTDGFRYASHLDEARALGLLLEDTVFRVLLLQIDFNGVKPGQLMLALPATGRGRRPQRPERPSHSGGIPAAQGPCFSDALRARVLETEAVVQAVLTRVSLPLAAILHMKPGDLLPLPQAALDRIDLAGQDGQICATGRLGQARGMRAVRLSQIGTEASPGAEASAAPAAAPMPVQAEGKPVLHLAATG